MGARELTTPPQSIPARQRPIWDSRHSRPFTWADIETRPHHEGAARTQPGEGVRYGEPTASRLRLNSSGPGYPAPEAEGPKTFQRRRLTRYGRRPCFDLFPVGALGGRFDALHTDAREVRAADLDLPERGESHLDPCVPGGADSDFADPTDIGRVFLQPALANHR